MQSLLSFLKQRKEQLENRKMMIPRYVANPASKRKNKLTNPIIMSALIQQQQTQNHFLLPEKKEMMNAIIWATTTIFETTEEILFTSNDREVSRIRHHLFYLFLHYLEINDKAIKERMQCKSRGAIWYGASIVQAHKNIYRQCSDTLRKIIETANTFDKKHTWLIPSISTTY